MVRTLLTAVGDPNDIDKGGPVNYALDTMLPNEQAEQTAQRFLGLRMRCAQCHDHPFDIWTQDAYYGLAAFFAKVQRGGAGPGAMMGRDRVTINPKGEVVHLRTKKPVEPHLLDGKVVKVAAADDPRKALADWITASDNPYFARAMANWVWAQLFGKGLVDPPDDMSRANPPVHPALLDALARHFVEHKYDLRDLIRTITSSEAYGLSGQAIKGNEKDRRLFSHYLPRPLTAHQMADALAQATNVANSFEGGAGRGRGSARRAIEIYDPATPQPAPRLVRPMLADHRLCRQPRAGPEPPPGPAPDRRRRDRREGLQLERLPGRRSGARNGARGVGRKPLLSYGLPTPDSRGALAMVGRAEAGLVVARGGRRPVLGPAELAGVCVQPLIRRWRMRRSGLPA